MNTQSIERVLTIILDAINRDKPVTEVIIARRLKSSRTPVREILSHLEAEGIIERRQRKGISLRKPSLKEIIEIFDLRSTLEGLACRLFAQQIDRHRLAKIKQLAQRFDHSVRVPASEEMRARDLALHQYIISECGNTRLIGIIRRLHLLSQSFHFYHHQTLKGAWFIPKLKYPHQLMIRAFSHHDPEGAEMAVRRHIQEAKTNMIRIFLGKSSSASKAAS